MADREKVLCGWDRCSKCLYPSVFDQQFKDCEYTMGMYCRKDKLISETVELLKEQEAKWVEDKQGERCRLIKCSNCGLTFIVGNNIPYDEWIEDRNYCRRCGARMVKRND